jgi:hypothetical protein
MDKALALLSTSVAEDRCGEEQNMSVLRSLMLLVKGAVDDGGPLYELDGDGHLAIRDAEGRRG